MLGRAALAGALIFWASCNKSESSDPGVAATTVASIAPAKPASSGDSFSVELAKELGAGSAAKVAAGSAARPAEGPAAGSAARASAGSGARLATGAAAARPEPPSGAARLASGSAAPSTDTRPASTTAAAAASGAVTSRPAAGSAMATRDARPPSAAGAGDSKAAATVAAVDSKAAATAAVDTKQRPGAPEPEPVRPPVALPRGPVKVSGDLAAIKLSLLPNWDRDIGEAGTFQYVVRIKGTQGTKTFSFHYGYEDPRAPADREQYKKYLQDSRSLVGEIKERQRGSAWYLEGSDAAGAPAFRYVVLYGGKRLICYGSLYKDAESNRLGDDRDQTLIQAKQICETLAL